MCFIILKTQNEHDADKFAFKLCININCRKENSLDVYWQIEIDQPVIFFLIKSAVSYMIKCLTDADLKTIYNKRRRIEIEPRQKPSRVQSAFHKTY